MKYTLFMPKKHLVLLDANHLMHRAYWALPRTLKTKEGELTNAVYGVMSMLMKLLAIEKPDAVVACFDSDGDTFRHEDHSEYKAGRPETPQDFYDQIPRVEEGFHAFSIPIVALPRYEADDLIAAYAKEGCRLGYRVTIVTGDRDAFQLASPNVRIAIPHKGYEATEYVGPKEVETKFGVDPEHIPDYKGLVGDASDNLAGVPGIGPKRGKELLEKYGTLEGVYKHLVDLPEALQKKLKEGRESAYKTRELTTLVTDLKLPEKLAETPLRIDTVRVQDFFSGLQFHTLKKRFISFASGDLYGKEHCSRGLPVGRQGVLGAGKAGVGQLGLFDGRE